MFFPSIFLVLWKEFLLFSCSDGHLLACVFLHLQPVVNYFITQCRMGSMVMILIITLNLLVEMCNSSQQRKVGIKRWLRQKEMERLWAFNFLLLFTDGYLYNWINFTNLLVYQLQPALSYVTCWYYAWGYSMHKHTCSCRYSHTHKPRGVLVPCHNSCI